MSLVGSHDWSQAVTWNPLDKGAAVTLSVYDLKAVISTLNKSLVRATVGKSSGKWYWEVLCHGLSTTGDLGICTASADLNKPIGSSPTGWGYTVTGGHSYLNHNGVLTPFGGVYHTGSVIGFLLDCDLGTLGITFMGFALGIMASGITGTVYPAVSNYDLATCDYVARFASSSWSYSPPIGYKELTP